MLEGLYLSIVAGLVYGLTISLMGIGLSLIYGIMANVNVSHGTFYMLAAYAAFGGAFVLKFSPVLASTFGVALTVLVGVAAFVIIVPRKIRVTTDPDSQNRVAILLLGFAVISQQAIFLVFGGTTIPVAQLATGTIFLPGGAFISYQQLISSIIAVGVYGALYAFMFRTKMGRATRAFSQDRETAEAMGVNVSLLAAVIFGIGTGLAALSGVLLGAQYSVNPGTGWDQLMVAFVIVTLGGIGSLTGTMLAGLIYGTVFQVAQYFVPQFSFVAVVLSIYILIIVKPSGLMSKVVERD